MTSFLELGAHFFGFYTTNTEYPNQIINKTFLSGKSISLSLRAYYITLYYIIYVYTPQTVNYNLCYKLYASFNCTTIGRTFNDSVLLGWRRLLCRLTEHWPKMLFGITWNILRIFSKNRNTLPWLYTK